MAQTIFLRMPISKSNLLLLTIAIISLMSYLLLRRSKSRTDDILVTWPSLKMNKSDFILNGKPLRILSGAIHYFRVVPEYWKDRLLKLKGMGLNTVET